MALFRTQALVRVGGDLGAPLHWSPPRYRTITACVCLFACAGITGVLLLPYSEKLTLAGAVQAPLKPFVVVAGVAGRLHSVRVAAEAAVSAGAVLARLDLRRFVASGQTTADLEVSRLQSRLARLRTHQAAQATVAAAKLQELGAQRLRASDTATLFSQRTQIGHRQAELAATAHQRMERLQAARSIGPVEASRSFEALLAARQNLLAYDVELLDARHRQSALTAQQQVLVANTELEQLQYADRIAELQAEIARTRAQSMVAITAPHDGLVADVFRQPGDTVTAQTPILSMQASATERVIELYMPVRGMGRVAVGQQVKLKFDSYPYEQFGFGTGTVARVSPVGQPTQEGDVYLVMVDVAALPPAIAGLTPGTTVVADIQLARKAVWRWLVEPVVEMVARL